MLVGQHGYVPEQNFLTETLRCQARFHDPLQESLFSNSGTVQGYRAWSSGRSSPQSLSADSSRGSPVGDPIGGTMLVKSPRPIGRDPLDHMSLHIGNHPKHNHVSDNGVYEAHLPCLLTPRTRAPNGTTSKAIRYAIHEVSIDFLVPM